MTAFVLDASVTAAWLLPDAASEHTRRLYTLIRRDEVEPQAPNLWHWECHNILASGVNSGRIPAPSVEGLGGGGGPRAPHPRARGAPHHPGEWRERRAHPRHIRRRPVGRARSHSSPRRIARTGPCPAQGRARRGTGDRPAHL